MSNRLFQGIIHQMSEAIDRTIGVIDESSIIIACSDLSRVGDIFERATLDAMASEDVFVAEECTFKPFGPRQNRQRSRHEEDTDELGIRSHVSDRLWHSGLSDYFRSVEYVPAKLSDLGLCVRCGGNGAGRLFQGMEYGIQFQ